MVGMSDEGKPIPHQKRHSRAHIRREFVRARQRALRRFLTHEGWGEWRQEWIDNFVHRHSVDRKPCSCHMCGNRRPHEGPTLQEIKMMASELEEDLDLANERLDSDMEYSYQRAESMGEKSAEDCFPYGMDIEDERLYEPTYRGILYGMTPSVDNGE